MTLENLMFVFSVYIFFTEKLVFFLFAYKTQVIYCSSFKLFCLVDTMHAQTTNFPFLAHLSTECSVSYCDHSSSVRRPSANIFLVNTLASTIINQSAPNFVKMYMTTRSRINSIMEVIGPEL